MNTYRHSGFVTPEELKEIEAKAEACDHLPDDEAERVANEIAAQTGRMVARHYQEAAAALSTHPHIELPRLCHGCALRPGSEANTEIDGMGPFCEAIMSGVPFYCHEELTPEGEPTKFCAGWATMMVAAGIKASRENK